MPTLEKQISEYRRFGRPTGHREHARIEATTREHGIVCERGRQIPSEWFVTKAPLTNLAEWRGVFYRRKAISGGWTVRRASQNKRKRQAKTGIPHGIADAISSSRWILNLNDDWDEKGSSGYEQTTWQRACDFLLLQAKFARETHKRNLPAPRILPGPDGSIDVHWKMPQFELLVNIPEDPRSSRRSTVTISGTWLLKGLLILLKQFPVRLCGF